MEARNVKGDEAVRKLWHMAQAAVPINGSVARRLAEEMAAHAATQKVRIHQSVTHRFCGGCAAVLVPGANCRVRLMAKRKAKKGAAGKVGEASVPSRVCLSCYTCGMANIYVGCGRSRLADQHADFVRREPDLSLNGRGPVENAALERKKREAEAARAPKHGAMPRKTGKHAVSRAAQPVPKNGGKASNASKGGKGGNASKGTKGAKPGNGGAKTEKGGGKKRRKGQQSSLQKMLERSKKQKEESNNGGGFSLDDFLQSM